ncbi:hypothetical protein [Micromonospora sp. NBC_01813]|uniref:hypothetical protein n=1 Tax=Micromonospora sp. NBC_01813 TaxID=2975988 RepID=UPI002DDC3C33|nr:hypothetical protein [Micromonospora sp. NBC_01813]WSA11633.1 hypothetical protein OG958_13085 [Micromonospora sp. NBC_01813]
MRRILTPAAIVVGLLAVHVVLPAGPAVALPAQDPSAPVDPQVTPGERVCEITDERLRELSGLVATADGYVVVNDGTDIGRNERVFFLDSSCEVGNAVQYPVSPYDPEDLAISPDGQTLWIADIGDNPTNDERRQRIALWSMPADGSAQPVVHRLSYPDGPHDAEALLILNDGTPLIITKDTGPAGLYRPVEPLRSDNEDPVPMEKVGELELPRTNTPNLFAAAGRLTVTGAARSPDGTRVAIRTYADAFEWDVPADGDLVAALTNEQPRATPLTDAFGEAISYTADGASFVTVSDVATLDEDATVEILRYTPSTEVAAPTDTGSDGAEGPSWINRITLQDINLLIAAVGLLGAVLVGVGIHGIVRGRRKARLAAGREPARSERDGDSEPASAYASDALGSGAYASDALGSGAYASGALGSGAMPAGGPPGTAGRKQGAVYGGAKPAGGGGVYGGAKPAAGGGGVYGGTAKPPTGAVYGGAPAPPPPAAAPRRDSGGYRAAGAVDSGAVYGAAKPVPPVRPGSSGYRGDPDTGGDYPGDGYPADRYDQPRAGSRPPADDRDAGVYGRPGRREYPDHDRRG